MRYTLAGFLLLFFVKTATVGQPVAADTLFLRVAREQAVAQYQRAMFRQEPVYAGNEYITQDHRIKIHPFYPTDSLQAGSLTYNGFPYQNVAMLYDVVRDELAVRPPGSGFRVQVRSDKISEFALGTHQFVRLDSAAGLPAGFYELLYSGTVQVLSHRQKVIHEDISGGTYKADYLVKDRFYIRKDGRYYDVKSKGSALSVFGESGKALRKYVRANGLKFTDALRENALVSIAREYDHSQ